MNDKLDRTLLAELSGLIAERLGLHFPEERWPDLARSLCAAGRKLGFEHPDACLRWLKARELTPRQIETLASHLTVGETYFFRDPASFTMLENEILPPLIAQRAEAGRNPAPVERRLLQRGRSVLHGHLLHPRPAGFSQMERLDPRQRHQPRVSGQGRGGRLLRMVVPRHPRPAARTVLLPGA